MRLEMPIACPLLESWQPNRRLFEWFNKVRRHADYEFINIYTVNSRGLLTQD